jgi:hypothetical protein
MLAKRIADLELLAIHSNLHGDPIINVDAYYVVPTRQM